MNHIRRRLLISITLNQHHNHQARRLMSNFPEPPPGYQAHQEASTQILIKLEKQEQQPSEAFINPVQEYNRDLSISAIKAWSSIRNQELLEKKSNNSSKNQRKKNSNNKRAVDPSPENGTTDHHHQSKKLKQSSGSDHQSNPTIQEDPTSTISKESVDQAGQPLEPQVDRNPKKETQPQKFTALEALSATGLRAIRYAKEIPTLKSIIANDLSLSAVNLIKANITHNGLDPKDPSTEQAKVRVNQGDACDLMYSHRAPDRQFDVVDLDPYGTAAPFIDAAVQCVRNGGLLCVTCTDLAVLAGSAYPEKCFSNYGGSSMRAEYSHEYALRQVIHSLASSAARYGKQITPLLSLSIDFYVRIFVRVNHSPAEVKKWIT
ncbi:RNA methyltransferase tRNA(m5U54)methyltransferase [Puccinia graminis f. sp. tritici]|nr:RNA methyltransferase tRNA(m5U54)methyltransferase [Puccinia graminis f. sp. tritici]KAA1071105.1 RNA methyltransferase tRNA(m5U54)methyltransferase [Puccinia graminis f. sp. tritici]